MSQPCLRMLPLAMGLVACGGPLRAPLSGQVAGEGVAGVVTLEPVEGHQRLVTVALEGLPPPGRVGPALASYVVWFVAPAAGRQPERPFRAGELIYRPERREGRLHAVTGLERFQLRITAERSARTASPSEHVVVDQWVGDRG